MHTLHTHSKLRTWLPLSRPWHNQFSPDELRVLRESAGEFDPARRHIVFLTYENRLASHGGLGAVTRLFPAALHKAGERVLCVSPFHGNLAGVKQAHIQGELVEVFRNLTVSLPTENVSVTCYRDVTLDWPSFHLALDGHYTGISSPYDVASPQELLHESLLLCALLPYVLVHLGYRSHLVLHANDWETAPVVFAAIQALLDRTFLSARTVLTLHNSYDAPCTADAFRRYWGRSFSGSTVLESALALLSAPLTTVSPPFAIELLHDPLQTTFFAPHLQNAFSLNPPVGIPNGPFTLSRPALPLLSALEKGTDDTQTILRLKQQARGECEAIVRRRVPPGFPSSSAATTVPLFFMSGRMDPMQKGFDVLFEAFMRLEPGSARLFFSPTPAGGEQDADVLDFFLARAQQRADTILVYPGRIGEEEYHTILAGASFLVMPSFYEPFGAASEGFLHATPVVARACGGLLSQVTPLTPPRLPSHLSRFLKRRGNNPDGILYREHDTDANEAAGWGPLLTSRLPHRTTTPLFSAMVDAAHQALVQACTLYTDPVAYIRMVRAGYHTCRHEGWDATVTAYRGVYDASQRFQIT